MKCNAPAALLALAAFAVLPAKSTPTTALTLASLPAGIAEDRPGAGGNPVRLNGIGGGDIVDFAGTDDLPGLITSSLAPDASRGGGTRDETRPRLEPDPHEQGRVDTTLPERPSTPDAALPATEAGIPAVVVIAPDAAIRDSEPAAGADILSTPPAIKIARENAPKPRLTFIGLIKPEHIVREQHCLAEAVYFEARSESAEGRAAVAQVVLNRVKSGVYPGSVCGVVYQNRHRRLACQFTFACEGKALRVTEAGPWEAAVRIARDVYEGRIYLAEVGVATHYHADYVQPTWAKKLKKMDVIGRHIFYS